MNRQNFEWNKSPFSQEFKGTKTAGEFISIWNQVTNLDTQRDFAMPVTDAYNQTNAGLSTSCSSSQGSTTASKHPLSDSMDNSLPAPKRPNTVNQHANPIDDSILSKRIGELIKQLSRIIYSHNNYNN